MDYRSIIESRYNRENWQKLLHHIFNGREKFWNTPSPVNTSSRFAKQVLWLGTITLSDEQTIAVYEVELADSVDIERNRRGIRDMLLSEWRGNGNAGAFMFCYRKNESVLRFSYVSEAWTFAEDGTYQKESTDAKRFTYLLGEGHRSRTAIQQFEKLKDSSLNLKDLTKAFSVDAVSDMFFKEYKKNYEDIIFFVTGKRMVKVANKWEERQEGEPCEEIMQEFAHFPNPEKAVRDYVKKLMGRLVFLQFLQKKGWLGVRAGQPWGSGDGEFVQHLFADCRDKDHFVDNVLEALFNDLDSEDEIAMPQYRTPYLNGGLFERDASDESNFPLPAKYMQQLLDFFSSYNFTIDENDPDDAEVGVDPEMLGRIFENLLEDNKDKGAFYTPKEIVSYMCRESLIAYLQTDIDDEATKEAIRKFVTTHDANLLGDITNDVDQRLKDVKICDPAIGSGAFPMGLLKELFQCRSAIEGIDQSTAAEIKKHIIQNNIYGVDIEKGAVDIARLRFWLSLIVDEETPQALPNLDFKIMRGNSLLEQYNGFDLSTIMHSKKKVEGPVQMTFFEDDVDVLRRQVIGLRREYYRETNKLKKKNLRQQMREIVQKQINTQAYNVDLSKIDIADNSEFFLWHTWFADVFEKGGFDIVIANPPYVLVQTMNDSVLENLYKKLYSVASYKIDLYHLFIECGYNLIKEFGILTYITPTNYLTNNYTQPLRDLLLKKTSIKGIVNIGDDVFDASVNTGILMVRKEKSSNILCYYSAEYTGTKLTMLLLSAIEQEEYLKAQKHIIQPITSSASYELAAKIEKKADCLNKHATVNFGMQLRNRKIYSNDVIVSYDSVLPSKYHRKCLTGKDISKYVTTWNYRYCYFNEEARCGGCWLEKVHTAKNKILVRQVGATPVCGIDKLGLAVLNSAFMIVCHDIDPFGVLGIINSKLMQYYWKQKYEDKRKTFPKIKGTYLELLPIAFPSDEIVSIVKQIVCEKENSISADTSSLESEIDRLVYHLYGLTDEEIKIVEDIFQN